MTLPGEPGREIIIEPMPQTTPQPLPAPVEPEPVEEPVPAA